MWVPFGASAGALNFAELGAIRVKGQMVLEVSMDVADLRGRNQVGKEGIAVGR